MESPQMPVWEIMKKFLKLNAEKKLAELKCITFRISFPFHFFFFLILNEGKKETGGPGNSNCF